MKKLYYLLIVLMGVCMVACSNDDGVDNSQPTPEVPEPDKITLSQQTIEVGFEPDTYAVNVTSPYSWDAVSKNDWIVVDSPTGIAGTKQLSFSIARNEEEKVREGTIVVKNSDFNLITELYITQGAFVPSELSVTPKTLNFSAVGNEESVAVTANFEHSATTDADWLTITKTEDGYTIKASANPELEDRTAEVVISNEKYKVSETIQIAQEGPNEKQLIYYTSKNSSVVTPNNSSVFGANIISNTYNNGVGVIVFDGEVTTIGDYAFYDYDSLTSITIPDSVTTIGDYAFWGCSSLTSITIGNSVTTIGDYAFVSCDSLTSISIPDSVTTIGDGAFGYCSSLTSITIPDSVTTIGDLAFSGCSSLTSITIPDSVTTIGDWAFGYCSSLTSITIPDSVTTIGDYAFYDCSSLTSITIPDSVTTIGDYAFALCNSLTSVYCKATTPPAGGSDMFFNNASGRKIYVPMESVNAYKSAEGWSDYADAIVGYNF